MKTKFESSELLREAHVKQEGNEKTSLRSWASDAKISPTYLNLILNSKRLATAKVINSLAKVIDMDTFATSRILEARKRDWLILKGVDVGHLEPEKMKAETAASFSEIFSDDEVLLESWLPFALLEFSTCQGFVNEPKFLAEVFGVPEGLVSYYLQVLEEKKFLVRTPGGGLKKRNSKVRIPTTRSRKRVREFHAIQLQRAIDILNRPATAEDFQRRLITGGSIAINPTKIEYAKLRIEQFLVEMATELSLEPCEEVYQLQVQFFPQTKKV